MNLTTPNGVKPVSSDRNGKVGFWDNHWISQDIIAAQKRLNSLFSKRVEDLHANPGWTGKGPMEGKPRPCGCRSHFPDLVECPYCGKRKLKFRMKGGKQ